MIRKWVVKNTSNSVSKLRKKMNLCSYIALNYFKSFYFLTNTLRSKTKTVAKNIFLPTQSITFFVYKIAFFVKKSQI